MLLFNKMPCLVIVSDHDLGIYMCMALAADVVYDNA